MPVNDVIENIKEACTAAEAQINYIKTLVGKASDPRWLETDTDHNMMKTMAHSAVDIAITLTEAIKTEIPEPSP